MSQQEALDLIEDNIKTFQGTANGRIKVFATMEGGWVPAQTNCTLSAMELAERANVEPKSRWPIV